MNSTFGLQATIQYTQAMLGRKGILYFFVYTPNRKAQYLFSINKYGLSSLYQLKRQYN